MTRHVSLSTLAPTLGLDRAAPSGACHLPGSARGGDGFPPYDLARLPARGDAPEHLRLTLAVAGYREADLSIALHDGRLTVRGAREDEAGRDYLHRGIAARRFQRVFLLAPGIEVLGAALADGLLRIDLAGPAEPSARRIPIG